MEREQGGEGKQQTAGSWNESGERRAASGERRAERTPAGAASGRDGCGWRGGQRGGTGARVRPTGRAGREGEPGSGARGGRGGRAGRPRQGTHVPGVERARPADAGRQAPVSATRAARGRSGGAVRAVGPRTSRAGTSTLTGTSRVQAGTSRLLGASGRDLPVRGGVRGGTRDGAGAEHPSVGQDADGRREGVGVRAVRRRPSRVRTAGRRAGPGGSVPSGVLRGRWPREFGRAAR